jgi:spore coat polysaccharide biosynthesis predicted glycosyltransferase SpsG
MEEIVDLMKIVYLKMMKKEKLVIDNDQNSETLKRKSMFYNQTIKDHLKEKKKRIQYDHYLFLLYTIVFNRFVSILVLLSDIITT